MNETKKNNRLKGFFNGAAEAHGPAVRTCREEIVKRASHSHGNPAHGAAELLSVSTREARAERKARGLRNLHMVVSIL